MPPAEGKRRQSKERITVGLHIFNLRAPDGGGRGFSVNLKLNVVNSLSKNKRQKTETNQPTKLSQRKVALWLAWLATSKENRQVETLLG